MKTREITMCALFTAILCLCAAITIYLPFTSVGFTLQVAAVCVAGGVLGPRLGLVSVIIYIMLGLCGLPVFSGMRGGVGALFGPTGGYIIGFIFQVLLAGLGAAAIRPGDSVRRKAGKLAAGMTLGLIVLYAFGTAQLMLLTKSDLLSALGMAVIPFIPLDLVKIALAVSISIYVRSNIYNSALE